MPQIVIDIISLIGSIIRMLGMAAVGLAFGYLAVEMSHKAETWPMQAALFLGVAGLIIAMVVFGSPAGLGGFGLGFGAAIFIWALPKKQKENPE
jgi:hypothetical protein